MIRKAVQADIPAIVAMSRKFYATTSYTQLTPMSDDTVANLTEMLIDEGVMLVAEAQGDVVGMVGLAVVPFIFNQDVLGAHEVVWWVEPEAQGAGLGRALLEAVPQACRDAGASILQMISLASSPEHAAKMYERMGLSRSETSYMKEL